MVKVSKIVGCSGTYIAYVLIAMYAISCGQNQPGGEVVRQNSAGDSIMSLIEAGRSQNNNLEFRRQSLQKASDAVLKIKIDSIRLAYVSRLSLAYSNIGDSLNFRKANKTAIELAQETADTLVLAEAYWDLAYFYSGLAVKDSAFYYYLKAHEQFNAIQDDYHAARMLYNMAVEQASVKDYTGSEITTINAIELLKPLKKNKELFNCYNNLGSITKELHDFERAIDYYQIALSYAEKLPDAESSVNNVQNNIGNVYKEQGLYSEAILYYQKVLNSDSLLYKNPKSFAISLDNIAYSRLRNNNTENVRRDLEKALAISDSIHDFSGLAVSSYNLAEFHLWNKDTLSARSYAYQAKNYAQQSSNNKRLLETLALITKLDPGNAGALTADYIALNDSLQQAERQIRNKFERIRFETDEVVAQNQLLARQRQLWIGIAAGLLLLAVSLFIIIDQRVKNQKLRFQQQQQEANQEIFNMMLTQKQKIEESKKTEQKRISEELHDGVLGEMNGARMVLLGLNKKSDEQAVAMRSQAIAKLQEVQEEIRTISHELNDAAYQKFHNFIVSIEDLLKSVEGSAPLKISFTFSKEADWDNLNADIKINLYRIVQESLMNCVKHAQAQKVVLDFKALEEALQITITDDGKGFDTRKGKKGIGHKNISSRIKKLNGTWDISSKQGEGTKVSILIPCNTLTPAPQTTSITDGMLHQA